uniref:Uncharacterized protein n=1 Tax=Candidatus Kentrum sp. DK TaxID=2126562 RepID=A0A450RUK3_9GAMM|nr:MAG: hypothetical protein BECKDK2373C_GA0170839_10024 [Candidatus Kentron sp. DK]
MTGSVNFRNCLPRSNCRDAIYRVSGNTISKTDAINRVSTATARNVTRQAVTNFHGKVEHSLPRHPGRECRDPEARDGMLLPINFRETAIALQSNPNIRAAVSSVEEALHNTARETDRMATNRLNTMGWRENERVSGCVLCGQKQTTLYFMRIHLNLLLVV